jgi:hypothetical protein
MQATCVKDMKKTKEQWLKKGLNLIFKQGTRQGM